MNKLGLVAIDELICVKQMRMPFGLPFDIGRSVGSMDGPATSIDGKAKVEA
jgi:hypothetical protein